MRLVITSDTHGLHHLIDSLPEGDVLVHAGDFMNSGYDPADIAGFNRWLGEQSFMKRVVIGGNHDRLFENVPDIARSFLTNAIYLENSGVTIDGVSFWGSPYTPEFLNWAFMYPRGSAAKKYWDQIPVGLDVRILCQAPQMDSRPPDFIDRIDDKQEDTPTENESGRERNGERKVMASESRLHVAALRKYQQKEIETAIRQMKTGGGTLDECIEELKILANFIHSRAEALKDAWPNLLKGTACEEWEKKQNETGTTGVPMRESEAQFFD